MAFLIHERWTRGADGSLYLLQVWKMPDVPNVDSSDAPGGKNEPPANNHGGTVPGYDYDSGGSVPGYDYDSDDYSDSDSDSDGPVYYLDPSQTTCPDESSPALEEFSDLDNPDVEDDFEMPDCDMPSAADGLAHREADDTLELEATFEGVPPGVFLLDL
jgi:hypothetical protein